MFDDDPIRDDPIPDGADETEAELRPDDPAERLASRAPSVSNPAENLGPEIPEAPEFDASDADPELQRQFWSLVLLFNVALFGIGLGAMLVVFDGRWRFGGAVFAVGVIAFARGWRGYQQVTGESASANE